MVKSLESVGVGVAASLLIASPLIAGEDYKDLAPSESNGKTTLPAWESARGSVRQMNYRAGTAAAPRSDSDFDLARYRNNSAYGDAIALGILPGQPADKADSAVKPAAASNDDLASQATNPISNLVQFQIQDIIVGESFAADGAGNQLLLQPVIPWKLGDFAKVTRITTPVVWTPTLDATGDSYTGIGDTALLDFFVFNDGAGGMWGVGPSLVFPTASSDFTGQGQWQAGPALLYINVKNPKLQWGMLSYQNWSFENTGGNEDKPDVSVLFLQPIVTWHFKKGWYLGISDIPMSINWENGSGEWAVPLGLKLGAIGDLGGQKVNAFVMPFWVAGKPDTGNEWGIKFGISLLFPQG